MAGEFREMYTKSKEKHQEELDEASLEY